MAARHLKDTDRKNSDDFKVFKNILEIFYAIKFQKLNSS